MEFIGYIFYFKDINQYYDAYCMTTSDPFTALFYTDKQEAEINASKIEEDFRLPIEIIKIKKTLMFIN